MPEHVVITGTGLASALGHNPDGVFQALLAGITGIRLLDDSTSQGLSGTKGAPAAPLGPNSMEIMPRLAGLMEKHLSLLFHASSQALADHSPETSSPGPEEIGFYAGMGMVDYGIADLLPAVVKSRDSHGSLDYGQFYAQGYREIYPLWPLAMLNNVAFCQVAISLGLRGVNAVFSPHADAAVQAIAEGAASLQSQTAKLVLAGGVSETLSSLSLNRARLSGILPPPDSSHNGCHPFAAQRHGTVLGEGAGMVAMELESTARVNGNRPLARLTGFGFSCETNNTPDGPSSNALAYAMSQALNAAGIEPAAVDVVIAHGDGTVHGDNYELEAIHQVFFQIVASLPVFSSKGALGHLLAASPALDLVLATQMIKNQVIPPCPFCIPLDLRVRFVIAAEKPLPARVKTVLINACSPEGPCATMVLEALS
jgi:3-oxoacyl-[acyl-carrier-protein] synthase II